MKRLLLASFFIGMVSPALGSQLVNGPLGINSTGLTLADGVTPLDGSGSRIGQVEPGRPGKPVINGGFDDTANSNTTIVPTEVYIRGVSGAPIANMLTRDHATEVAGTMISTDPLRTGVSTKAKLYSSAWNPNGPDFDAEAAITLQFIAENSGDPVVDRMYAINASFGIQLKTSATLNGNSLLTQFIDWSAQKHDVLYVIAGNEGSGGNPIPTDNFNGMTIGLSTQVGGTGAYRQVDSSNIIEAEDALGDRTTISLIAPGRSIQVTGLGNAPITGTGTSFAAPLVTATVALLQQYATERINTVQGPRWNIESPKRHQVMKAVLMNSADKLIDNKTITVNSSLVDTGNLLGMEKTILKKDGTTWLNSPAYDKSFPDGPGVTMPLDPEMGAGQLNAARALRQFAPGEFNATDDLPVPVIGWDYGHTTGVVNSSYDYEFNQPLLGNSFISVTMAWDRIVQFDNDGGTPDKYDPGDTFVPSNDVLAPGFEQYSDLDIYLLRADDFNINLAIAASRGNSTIEHLFFQIPETGSYKIWVVQTNDNAGRVDYGMAWWAVAAPTIAGDFNGDNVTDAADLALWQANFPLHSGAILSDGDSDGDGDVDGADFIAWQTAYTAATTVVPEPSAIISIAAALIAVVFVGRKRLCK